MPVRPAAASAEPWSWTPPSVVALKPAACIAAKSVEVKRYIPRIAGADLGAATGAGGFAAGDFFGVGEGECDGVGVGLVCVGSPDVGDGEESRGTPETDGLDRAGAVG